MIKLPPQQRVVLDRGRDLPCERAPFLGELASHKSSIIKAVKAKFKLPPEPPLAAAQTHVYLARIEGLPAPICDRL
jgi:hypothetical protein